MWGGWKCLKTVKVFHRYLLCSILFSPECNLQNALIQLTNPRDYQWSHIRICTLQRQEHGNPLIPHQSHSKCRHQPFFFHDWSQQWCRSCQWLKQTRILVTANLVSPECSLMPCEPFLYFSRSSFSTCDLLIRLIRCLCPQVDALYHPYQKPAHPYCNAVFCKNFQFENMNLFCL